MRSRLTVALLLYTIILASGDSALAYQDTGFDPDDRSLGESDPDIRSSTRRVEPSQHGRVLSIRVRTYEPFGPFWELRVFLDSKGGRRADYLVLMTQADVAGRCTLDERGGGQDETIGRLRSRQDVARCRLPARLVDPDKQPRWRIVSPSQSSNPGAETERAPNEGWYS
jgi:hypothetical protein